MDRLQTPQLKSAHSGDLVIIMRQLAQMLCVVLAFLPRANPSPAVEALLDEYRQQGAGMLALGWQVSSGYKDDRWEISKPCGRTPGVAPMTPPYASPSYRISGASTGRSRTG